MIIAVAVVMNLLQPVFIPLVIAILVATILGPIIRWFIRFHFPRILALIIVIIIFLVFIFLLFLLFYSSMAAFLPRVRGYIEGFSRIIEQLLLQYDLPFTTFSDFGLTDRIVQQLLSLSGSLVNFITSLGMVVLFVIFILAEDPLSRKKIFKAFPGRPGFNITRILRDVNSQISRYLTLKLLISLGTGLLVGVSLRIIGVEFYLMWGILAVLFNFIPNIGSLLIMIFTIIISFVQFYPEWNPIIATMITMIGIQVVMGNFLDPRLQGHHLDLSPLAILISLVFWAMIWGIPGMFLAVPLTEMIKILCRNIPALHPVAVLLSSGKRVTAAPNIPPPTQDEEETEE